MVIVTIEAFTGSFTEIKYTTMTTTGLNGDSDEIASHAGNCSAWRQRVRTATRKSWPDCTLLLVRLLQWGKIQPLRFTESKGWKVHLNV